MPLSTCSPLGGLQGSFPSPPLVGFGKGWSGPQAPGLLGTGGRFGVQRTLHVVQGYGAASARADVDQALLG